MTGARPTHLAAAPGPLLYAGADRSATGTGSPGPMELESLSPPCSSTRTPAPPSASPGQSRGECRPTECSKNVNEPLTVVCVREKFALIKMRRRAAQLELRMFGWGGARKGAGRKAGPGRRPTPHRVRPAHKASHPVHLTMRAVRGLPSLRRPAMYRVALPASPGRRAGRFGWCSSPYSAITCICWWRPATKNALSGGARGLAIRSARRLNRHLGLGGQGLGRPLSHAGR